MLVKDLLDSHKTTFSFEFFPPKEDAAADRLLNTISNLMPLGPSYVSVTYGAGGTTRDRTHDLVVRIKEQTDITVVSHLTCVGSTRTEIHCILEKYQAAVDRRIGNESDCAVDNVFSGTTRVVPCLNLDICPPRRTHTQHQSHNNDGHEHGFLAAQIKDNDS